MRADRLIGMLMLLQARGPTTAGRLAEELGVSRRTILRDVEALSYAGVPIFTVRGPKGGVELLEGFRTEITGLNAAEAGVLLLSGLPALASQIDLGDVAGRARRKLMNALTPQHRDLAESLDGWLHIDLPQIGEDARKAAWLPRLLSAISGCRAVRIRIGRAPSSKLFPLGLVLAASGWHLLGIGPNVIAVDRITELRLLNETFDRPDDFDLEGHWANSQGSVRSLDLDV